VSTVADDAHVDVSDARSERFSSLTVFACALAVIAAIGVLDYATGPYFSLTLFYLAPIWLVTASVGRAAGIMTAIACSVVSLTGDVSTTTGLLPFWNAASRMGVFAVVALAVARLSEAHRRERELARTDQLTGLANFRWFEDQAKREMYSVRRYGGPLSLAYIDLDGFKGVNDTHGHAAGDAVLCAVADSLRAGLRPTDLIARVGGDEFVALFPHTDRESAGHALERVRATLAIDERSRGVGFSAGITQLHDSIGSIDDVLGAADQQMYEVKAAKRGAGAAPPIVAAPA
jgi:diguanylate cyclase (GGDEF)-like protein